MRARSIPLAAVVLLVSPACRQLADPVCAPLSSADRARVAQYVQKKHRLPSAPEVALVSGEAPDCYQKLRFAAGGPGRGFRLELYLAPDRLFLTQELMDSRLDPMEEARRKERALLEALAGKDRPTLGAAEAPVLLTVFSDFQCPYCAGAARMLKDEILPREEGNVRLVFRHFPLVRHDWARQAAEAAECARSQGNQHFWKIHDFLFEHQQEITAANLRDALTRETVGFAGFDRQVFGRCLDAGTTNRRVEEDLEFGKNHGITATPTLFVNTQPLKGVGSPEHVRTLIRELAPR